MGPFGYTDAQWKEAKREAVRAIAKAARTGSDVSYTELAKSIDAIDVEAHDPRLSSLLDDMAHEYERAASCVVTALVVLQDGRRPSTGFYDVSRRMGYKFTDDIAFWVEQRTAAIDFFKSAEGRKLAR